MSQAADVDVVGLERAVEYRSRNADVVHRSDSDSDESVPACPEADVHDDRAYREVALAAIASHRRLCQNPECFGGDWR